MNFKLYFLITALCVCSLFSAGVRANEDDNYSVAFKNASFQSCDKIFHKLEDGCENMICRDVLVGEWAECWKRSMNSALNKRLLKLKNTDIAEFHFEMDLQKKFNEATRNLCGKDCGPQGTPEGTMRGIPYNFCRVDAYKYRVTQAMQVNVNQLTIPGKVDIKKSYKEKIKDTLFFNRFTEQLCHMPKDVWNTGAPPTDCQKKAFAELNVFEFTDDVCNLS